MARTIHWASFPLIASQNGMDIVAITGNGIYGILIETPVNARKQQAVRGRGLGLDHM